MKKDTLEKFAALIAALSAEREADGSFPRTIAPDVAEQVKDIESLYYGLGRATIMYARSSRKPTGRSYLMAGTSC